MIYVRWCLTRLERACLCPVHVETNDYVMHSHSMAKTVAEIQLGLILFCLFIYIKGSDTSPYIQFLTFLMKQVHGDVVKQVFKTSGMSFIKVQII